MIPGVIYRLQNVEYGTYLEIGLATEGSPIPMRPIKEFSEKQQWTFSEVPGTSSYILRNLAVSGTDEDSVHKRMVYQAHNVQAFTATNTYDVSRAIAWIVEGDGEEYLIKFMYGNHQYRHLVCTTHETTYIVQQPYTFQTALDNAKWRLIPVWPSLPRDDYLIRNMNGLALHMSSPHPMSVRKDYTPGPLALNKEKENVHQTWDVQPLLNGKILLRNIDLGIFLTHQRSDDTYGHLVGKKTGVPWQLRKVGSLGYSISVQIPEVTHKPLALTLLEGRNQVVIAPLSESRNQLWMFELAEIPFIPMVGVSLARSALDGTGDE